MADKLNVERLFALPYFQQTFNQMIKPIADTLGQTLYIEDGIDPGLISKATEEAYKHVYHGMLEIMMDFYVEILADEDVAFLHEVYQHPAFLKVQSNMPSMLPKVIAWHEENESVIRRSIEAAIDKAL